METHFRGVDPALGAGHLLPLVAAAGGVHGVVQVLEQLAVTRFVVLVQWDAGPDQLFPREFALRQELRVGLAVVRLWDQREEHGAGEVERECEVRDPAPHNHFLGVAAKAADARKEFGLVIHFGRRQRFVATAGAADLR